MSNVLSSAAGLLDLCQLVPRTHCTVNSNTYFRLLQLHIRVRLEASYCCTDSIQSWCKGKSSVDTSCHVRQTSARTVAEPQAAQQQTKQADHSIIKDSDSTKEGPIRAYLKGRKSGLYRSDPRQETTIQLLQALYDELKKVHLDHKRPSGLTTTDHIGTDSPRHSWYTSMTLVPAITKLSSASVIGLSLQF